MRNFLGRVATVLAVTMLLAGCGIDYDSPNAGAVTGTAGIKVLSNRADIISGGDALVEIVPAASKVLVGSRDVTDAFAFRPNGRFMGRLTDLAVGANVVTATLTNGQTHRITIRNFPIGGPVISGEQVQPWICNTEAQGLGPAQDAQCNAPTVYSYQCGNSRGQLAACDPANPPSDLAMTTTDQGETVPFIVRIEKGVMNRGIYAIAVLYNPDEPWEPWAPQRGWNHKIHIMFGSACEMGHRQTAPPSVTGGTNSSLTPNGSSPNEQLGKGFLIFGSEMTQYGDHCNDLTSAETVIMLKEHIVETYGEIRYTIGSGCSGGSHQLHLISSNYPGVLQGLLPSCTFQDTWTVGREFMDCYLLKRYEDSVPGMWSEAEILAVHGHASSVCNNPGITGMAVRAPNYFDPTVGTNCEGFEWTYDPETNRTGTRCTLQDYQVGIFGRRPVDGFAKRAYDNVGIQYGWAALQKGDITPEKFLHLNENIGGTDIDFNFTPQRSIADLDAVEIAHRSGRVVNGRELAKVADIDLMGGIAGAPASEGEEHYDFRSYVIEARLKEANGHAENHVIWKGGAATETFDMMDGWLTAIEADTSADPLETKVVRNKPANLVDSCFIGDAQVTDTTACAGAYPHGTDTRVAAGEDWTSDIMKCQLKPLSRSDYTVNFTDAQWARLQAVFPDGVCDFSKPGMFQGPHDPWTTFVDGPGGRPLGPVPVSSPL